MGSTNAGDTSAIHRPLAVSFSQWLSVGDERPEILAQPGTFCASAAAGTCDPSGPWTWTPEILIASYVKWIEASGARVVPIRSTASAAERASLFASINGLLIPGGDDITLTQWNNAYNNATRAWLQLAFDANRAGDPFAVWATCQGFEQLAVFASAPAEVSRGRGLSSGM